MKKTLIICGTTILVAVIALITTIVLKADGSATNKEYDKSKELKELPDMTYEEFTKGMSKDLSREVLAEVDALFEEYQSADQERRNEIFTDLYYLGVYEGKEYDKEAYDKKQYDKSDYGK